MRGVNLVTAHQNSCLGAPSLVRFFDLMFIMTENPCSHSQVEGTITAICGIAWEARDKCEVTILSQKFMGEHSVFRFCCLVLLNIYQLLLLPSPDR